MTALQPSYGDFGAPLEDLTAQETAGGLIVRLRGAGSENWGAGVTLRILRRPERRDGAVCVMDRLHCMMTRAGDGSGIDKIADVRDANCPARSQLLIDL